MTREEITNYIRENYNEIQQLELLLEIFANMMDAINCNSIAPTEENILQDLDIAYSLLSKVKKEVSK